MATTSADEHGYAGTGDSLGTRDDNSLTAMFGASPLPDVADQRATTGWYDEDAAEEAGIVTLSGNGTASSLPASVITAIGTVEGVVTAGAAYWNFDGGSFTLNYGNYSNGTVTDISVKNVEDPDGRTTAPFNYSIAGTAVHRPDAPSPYHPTTAAGNPGTLEFPDIPSSVPRVPHSSQWGSVTNEVGSWDDHYDATLNPLDPKTSSDIIAAKSFKTITKGTST